MRKEKLLLHRYFSTYPIEDASEALWFSKPLTYSILNSLQQAGPNGLSPSEVHNQLTKAKLNVGRSRVYETLRALYEQRIVERKWDNESNAHRSILAHDWAPASLEGGFEDWIDDNFGDLVESTLFPVFLNFVSEVTRKAHEGKIPTEFMPLPGKEGWCETCGVSHQAQMFFLGLLYYAAAFFALGTLHTVHTGSWEFNKRELEKSIIKLFKEYNFAAPEANLGEQAQPRIQK